MVAGIGVLVKMAARMEGASPGLSQKTLIYGSDFSVDEDGFVGLAATVAGNIDGILGVDDCLRFYANGATSEHWAQKSLSLVQFEDYDLEFDYYIPDANSNVKGLAIKISGAAFVRQYINSSANPSLSNNGKWVHVTISNYHAAFSNRIDLLMTAVGGTTSFTGANSASDDLVYIKNFKLALSGLQVSAYPTSIALANDEEMTLGTSDLVPLKSESVEEQTSFQKREELTGKAGHPGQYITAELPSGGFTGNTMYDGLDTLLAAAMGYETPSGPAITGDVGVNTSAAYDDITTAGATFAASDVGKFIRVISGAGEGQVRRISAYTSTTAVDIFPAWDIVPTSATFEMADEFTHQFEPVDRMQDTLFTNIDPAYPTGGVGDADDKAIRRFTLGIDKGPSVYRWRSSMVNSLNISLSEKSGGTIEAELLPFDLARYGDVATNGNFKADSGWTKGTGWTIASDKATHAAGSGSDLEQDMSLAIGSTYRVEYVLSGVSAGTVTLEVAGATGTARSVSGNYTESLAVVDGSGDLKFTADAAFAGSVEIVKVTEIVSTSWGEDHNSETFVCNELAEFSDLTVRVAAHSTSVALGSSDEWGIKDVSIQIQNNLGADTQSTVSAPFRVQPYRNGARQVTGTFEIPRYRYDTFRDWKKAETVLMVDIIAQGTIMKTVNREFKMFFNHIRIKNVQNPASGPEGIPLTVEFDAFTYCDYAAGFPIPNVNKVGSNLVVNGDFGTDLTGWTNSGYNTFVRNTTVPINGSGDLHVIESSGGGAVSAYASVGVLGSTKAYILQSKAREISGNVSTLLLKSVSPGGAAPTLLWGTASYSLDSINNKIYQTVFKIDPADAAETIYLHLHSAGDAEAYADDFVVYESGTFPEIVIQTTNQNPFNQLRDQNKEY